MSDPIQTKIVISIEMSCDIDIDNLGFSNNEDQDMEEEKLVNSLFHLIRPKTYRKY